MKILILFFLLSTSSFASTSWKLPELARTSNALLVEMDSVTANKKSNCGLDTIQISQASQNLQILVDDRISKLKGHDSQLKSLLKSCESDCSCDVYQYALEKLSPDSPNTKTAGESNKTTTKQRKACYQKLANFCSSKLFRSLFKK